MNFFKKQVYFFSHNEVVDTRGKVMEPYPGAEAVLKYILNKDIPICAFSQSNHPKLVSNLVYLFKWHTYFLTKLIGPSGVTKHFQM